MLNDNIKEMEYNGLSMVSNNLTPPDEVVFPEGYTFRLFQDGDDHHWARIAYQRHLITSVSISQFGKKNYIIVAFFAVMPAKCLWELQLPGLRRKMVLNRAC